MDYLIYNIGALPRELEDNTVLTPDEQQAALQRGGNYALFRTILRRELARRTGLAAQDISIRYSEHGKPECEAQPFNLSHSGDCLCLAFHHKAVGVDVERIRPRNFQALAERFMCDEQLEGFISRGCPETEFFICWSAAEALVKHAGDTMWHAKQYPFVYYPGRIECRFADAPVVHLFTPMPGYQGAVAYSLT